MHGDTLTRANFTGQKLAFFEKGLIFKKEFFNRYGAGADGAMHFEKFSEREVNESGGYYGILCMNSNMSFTKRKKKKIINQIRERDHRKNIALYDDDGNAIGFTKLTKELADNETE